MTVALRGETYLQTDTRPASLALPAATQIGDLLLIVAAGSSVTTAPILAADSRLTSLASQPTDAHFTFWFWKGTATTLAPLAISSGSGGFTLQVTAFPPPLNVGTPTVVQGTGDPYHYPSVRGRSAVAMIASLHGPTAFLPPVPPGYTDGIGHSGLSATTTSWWNSTGAAYSPASDPPSGSDNWAILVLGLDIISVAPACRLYPRSGIVGTGSARLYPHRSTRQQGRLTGPY